MSTQNQTPFSIVVGLGKTGLSCIEFLSRQQHTIVAMDDRLSPPGLKELTATHPDVSILLGNFDEAMLSTADQIILSPGISPRLPLFQRLSKQGIPIIGDIELFAQHVQKPVIAITGSNGKSTVTALVGDLLNAGGKKAGVGGNIGLPALELLNQDDELYVLELSSFQLETTYSLKPWIACVLNVSEDHMDRYDDIEDYAAVKRHIYSEAKNKVFNRFDSRTTPDTDSLSQEIGLVDFGSRFSSESEEAEHHFYLESSEEAPMISSDIGFSVSLEALKLIGQHNIDNAIAAVAIAYLAGVDTQGIEKGFSQFKGLKHRCELVKLHSGIRWINDSKATNVGSAIAAINGLKDIISGQLVLIMGGVTKGADFSPLVEVLNESIKVVILLGTQASDLKEVLDGQVTLDSASTMKDAVSLARDYAEAEDMVLLSPACASFDLFDNFEQRGNVFIECVEAITQ